MGINMAINFKRLLGKTISNKVIKDEKCDENNIQNDSEIDKDKRRIDLTTLMPRKW
jgi:hypothetical protein